MFNTIFYVNQSIKPLTDAMTLASLLTSRQLKNRGDDVLVYAIASGYTRYLKPLRLALYQTCHQSGNALDIIAPSLATRLDVVPALNHLRNIDLLEYA